MNISKQVNNALNINLLERLQLNPHLHQKVYQIQIKKIDAFSDFSEIFKVSGQTHQPNLKAINFLTKKYLENTYQRIIKYYFHCICQKLIMHND